MSPARWPNSRGYCTRSTDWVGGNARAAGERGGDERGGRRAGAGERDDGEQRRRAAPAASASSARGPRVSISRAVSGAPSPLPSASAPEAAPAAPNEPGLGLDEQHDRQPVDAHRQPRQQRRAEQPRHGRGPEDLEVQAHASRHDTSLARSRAAALTAPRASVRAVFEAARPARRGRRGRSAPATPPRTTARGARRPCRAAATSALRTGTSRLPLAGSSVVTTQRGTGSTPRRRAPPTASSRPAHRAPPMASTPPIVTFMRKRRASGTAPPSAGASAATVASDTSESGWSPGPIASASRASSRTGRPRCSDTAAASAAVDEPAADRAAVVVARGRRGAGHDLLGDRCSRPGSAA